MFVTSVSAIKTFWQCPTRWYLQYVYPKRVPRLKGVALIVGSEWHLFMEDLLNGIPRQDALGNMETRLQLEIDFANNEGFLARAKDLEKEREKLLVGGELWQDWEGLETLAVEKALSIEIIPDVARLIGRQDRVIRCSAMGNRIGHYQHRTFAASKPLSLYLDTFHRNPHEGAYWKMIEQEYGEEPFGVMLSAFRKLSPKSILEKPQVALQQHPVPISKLQSERTVRNIMLTITRMLEAIVTSGRLLYENPDMDNGMFGSARDPYFEYLNTGDMDLLMDDNKFTDVENRYPELAEE